MSDYMKNTNYKIKIALLYLIMIAGGLWHILDVFQYLMNTLAAPFMIILSIAMYAETARNIVSLKTNLPTQPRVMMRKNYTLLKFSLWSILVIVGGFIVEWVGVRTGYPFGEYSYSDKLLPIIDDIPISIGFAWLSISLGAIGVTRMLVSHQNIYVLTFVAAIIMVLFDLFMEPAAVRLEYWHWEKGTITLQNYLAWFVLGYIFIIIGYKLIIFKNIPKFVNHAFYAQLIYFMLVNLS
jgi:putative membrane protein